jgi:hypothetical protein
MVPQPTSLQTPEPMSSGRNAAVLTRKSFASPPAATMTLLTMPVFVNKAKAIA